jgi:hypothetical protein
LKMLYRDTAMRSSGKQLSHGKHYLLSYVNKHFPYNKELKNAIKRICL